MAFDRYARLELERFFSRREERGKFYCGACLVQQLTQRGARKVTGAAWTAATKEVVVRPGLLQVRADRSCEICKQPGLTIGVEAPDGEVGEQEVIGRVVR